MSKTYRYVGEAPFSHKGEALEYGDSAELSEYTVTVFDDLFEEVEAESAEDDSEDSEDEDEFDVEEASYQELQAKASEFDDVDGRGKKEDLREAVRNALEE